MKIFGKKLEDFYKWVKGTELVILEDIDVKEDPVRPELTLEWRKDYGRQIFGLKYEDSIEGVVCVAYTKDVPHSVRELELMSGVSYTVWSRKRGAGKEIITKLMEHVQKNTELKRMVTLSPLTPMATHFHIRNGAKLIKHNPDTQNFEYKL